MMDGSAIAPQAIMSADFIPPPTARMVPGWTHTPGRHCASTAISDLTRFLGFPLSEPMSFGLGSGIDFFYIVLPGISPSRTLHPRGPDLEENAFRTMGIPFDWRTIKDPEAALRVALEAVDRGEPIILRADLAYLHYYNSNTHFAGHVVVLWGYDEPSRQVFLADTQYPGLQSVPFDAFMAARSSKHPPFNLDGEHHPIPRGAALRDLADAIPESIRRTAEHILGTEQRLGMPSGVPGLRVAAVDLPNWKDAEDWSWCCRFAYQIIERRGTGGGGFRRLYAGFLEEAETFVPALKGKGFADRMSAVADAWTEVSRLFKIESEKPAPDNLAAIADALNRIADEEEKFFLELPKTL